jgi:hypothetical protein
MTRKNEGGWGWGGIPQNTRNTQKRDKVLFFCVLGGFCGPNGRSGRP